jgi:Family of unknown function (DUF5906)
MCGAWLGIMNNPDGLQYKGYGMVNRVNKQELKEDLRAYVQDWFQADPLNKYQLGNYYRVESEQTRTVKHLSRETIKHMVVTKAEALSEDETFHLLGNKARLSLAEVSMIIQGIDANFAMRGLNDDIVAVGDTPLDGDYSNRPYAINRLPVDFGLPQTIAEADRQAFLDILMEQLPEFYHDLKSRMVSPEMWDILTCFFGRVVSEDTPSEEFVYWWGEGGDGKGSLTDLFLRNMPESAAPISHSNFESRFGGSVYGNKRFVRIDEAPAGNFFTERVKEVTGGAEFLSIERKGKDPVTMKSRLALMFASNFRPSFDNTMAHRRRLRAIECTPRTSPARDVKSELEASFGAFLGYCLINYEIHSRKIPMNNEDVLQKLSDETNLRADTWIISNIEYKAGGWMSKNEIQNLFNDTNRCRSLSYEAMMKRFGVVLQKQSTDGGVVMGREKSAGWGWQNVQQKDRGGRLVPGRWGS